MDNEKRKRKEALKKMAKLESGREGRKQGEKMIESVTIDNPKYNPDKKISSINKPTINVAPDYEVNGVKAKNLKEGATINKSKYGAPKGKLGGGVGRTPMYDKTKNKLESVESASRNFVSDPSQKTYKATPDSKVIQTDGYDVKSKTSEGLSGKVNEALTQTKIGKDISDTDKAFSEAPEFTRNRAKQLAKPKYTKGSRTVMQVIENADVKTDNASSGLKEGSRKLYKKLRLQNKK